MFFLFTALFGQDSPALEIQPHGQEISRVEGESVALTCKLKVGDSNQVTQLEWVDSRNEVIRNTDIRQGIYIQVRHILMESTCFLFSILSSCIFPFRVTQY